MTYYGANKQQYQLNDIPIKKGGEGAIHTVQGKSNLLAKIYLAPAKSPELQEKITLMVKNPPRKDILDQIAWPIDTLSDAGGNFVGFVMPKLSIDVELGDVYKYPAKKNITLTGEQKVIIAVNICRVISAIHDLDYVFGDFNPCNIGVNLTNGHVAFLDTDSYHITDKARGKTYRCNVCLNGYVAPELIKKCKNISYSNAPLPTFTKETDLFSLAIHVFKLLMNGFTPYNGIPENERSSTASPGVGNAAIEMDHYCFKAGNRPLSVAVLPLQAFPNDIQMLFTRAFDEGHQNPSRRPSANEWDKALTNYHSNLKKCSNNPMHFHYNGLQNCPYCEADQRYTYTMSMSSVYGASSTSSSGQMSFSQPMTPPPSPPPTNNYSSSNTSGSSQYTSSVFSGVGHSSRPVSQRNTNGASKKIPKVLIIIGISLVLIFGGTFGIITGINNSKVNKVEALISELPTDENYYLDYQAEIVDAYAAYMELDEKLRDKVENADVLLSVMDGLKVAEAYEQRQNMQFTELESGGYSVKLKEGANSKISGELVIPGVYRQQPVVAIEDYAFENCRSITSVVVPDSITTIGVGAFKGCNKIESMTLPFTGRSADATAYESVFGYIFGYATTQEDDDYKPNNNFINSQYDNIEMTTWQYSRYNCDCAWGPHLQSFYYYVPTSIKNITITNQSEIKDAAFNGCNKIETINYNKTVESIGIASFQNCKSLLSFNTTESGVLDLNGYFDKIPAYAFKNCENILSISITSNIMSIENNAFEGCQRVEEITLHSNVIYLGDYAFSGLKKVSSIVIPNSVETIGRGVLQGCNQIEKISLPFTGRNKEASAYEAVLGYVFGYTTTQKDDSYKPSNNFVNSQYGNIEISIWQYSRYNYNGPFGNTIQSFYYYIPVSLKEVEITNQSDIATAAFNGCTMLEKITFTQGISSQGECAFQNCNATIVQ